jgi:hypothetical protein
MSQVKHGPPTTGLNSVGKDPDEKARCGAACKHANQVCFLEIGRVFTYTVGTAEDMAPVNKHQRLECGQRNTRWHAATPRLRRLAWCWWHMPEPQRCFYAHVGSRSKDAPTSAVRTTELRQRFHGPRATAAGISTGFVSPCKSTPLIELTARFCRQQRPSSSSK